MRWTCFVVALGAALSLSLPAARANDPEPCNRPTPFGERPCEQKLAGAELKGVQGEGARNDLPAGFQSAVVLWDEIKLPKAPRQPNSGRTVTRTSLGVSVKLSSGD